MISNQGVENNVRQHFGENKIEIGVQIIPWHILFGTSEHVYFGLEKLRCLFVMGK